MVCVCVCVRGERGEGGRVPRITLARTCNAHVSKYRKSGVEKTYVRKCFMLKFFVATIGLQKYFKHPKFPDFTVQVRPNTVHKRTCTYTCTYFNETIDLSHSLSFTNDSDNIFTEYVKNPSIRCHGVVGPVSAIHAQGRAGRANSRQTSRTREGSECVYMCLYMCNVSYNPFTPYSARMSPENTHNLMGYNTDRGFNTRRYTLVHGFCFFKLFPIHRVKRWEGCTHACSHARTHTHTHSTHTHTHTHSLNTHTHTYKGPENAPYINLTHVPSLLKRPSSLKTTLPKLHVRQDRTKTVHN